MGMYEWIHDRVQGKPMPVGGVVNSGEHIIIEQGHDESEAFYRVTTLQNNDWLRINTYYACGDSNETYEKGGNCR